ncbi:hypothetical protein A1O7_01822 [Cladophialophora yegresii CBS 114405]|uniref:Uncharacterized protein n=1 Tax=Cladophialophora yegresii CBS 114405 TaxID=1182544 RepID=W9WLJ1_9EURO|nr:uncharacterized protein A1O7_01822 [Cladophialophora yegresii CBS 114405]EXJ65481.1 hypothetical protein A1O7_01822 [Cladophialophora yegresii CBS 114405]
MQPYTNNGPVDTDVDFDTSHVKGKTAVVTGGANGIGEAYVRALTKAGAFVVIADLDTEKGTRLEKEFGGSAKFVKTNVTVWADQLAAFKTAISSGPSGRVDIVVANAGISGADSVFFNNVDAEEPEEPKLNIINVNLIGVLYTIKLALHYFRRQNALNKDKPLDQVLVLQGSLAGYLDLAGAVQYIASKFGLRGILRSLRRTEHVHNIRVNYIGPWFVETKILSKPVVQHLTGQGISFATVEDAAQCLMRIVSDPSVNGRAFAIVTRDVAPRGYVDINFDDYEPDTLLGKLQGTVAGGSDHRTALKPEDQKTKTQWSESAAN